MLIFSQSCLGLLHVCSFCFDFAGFLQVCLEFVRIFIIWHRFGFCWISCSFDCFLVLDLYYFCLDVVFNFVSILGVNSACILFLIVFPFVAFILLGFFKNFVSILLGLFCLDFVFNFVSILFGLFCLDLVFNFVSILLG